MATRILIAEDHEVVRRGVRALLEAEPDLEVCGEVSNGQEAVEMAARLNPDLIIMDFSMPILNGLDATRYILDENPKAQVIMFTMHQSEHMARKVLEAGARGFVLKSDASSVLISAVRAVMRRQMFVSPEIEQVLLHGFLSSASRSVGDSQDAGGLSPREQEIMELLADGKTNKEVANTLAISVKTVETHRARIMSKLDLHSIGELVRYAVRNNFVQA